MRWCLLARTDETDVRAGWFLYERKDKHQQIAEAVAPALLGIRIECAQCHDHPLAYEIEQAHYWGLVAFFARGKNQGTPAGPRVVESAIGAFEKYTDLAGDSFDAQLTFFGTATFNEDRDEKDDSDELYRPGPGKEPRVPKFSRRQIFADRVLLDHPLLAKAFVNRMWALLIGRGFVHPVDRMDSMHEPSHPELLERLAEDFNSSDFDIRRLVRNIVLSDTYQLDSRRIDPQIQPDTFAFGLEKPLSAEAYLRSISTALTGSVAEPDDEFLDDFRTRFGNLFAEENVTDVSQSMYLANNQRFNLWITESPLLEKLRRAADEDLPPHPTLSPAIPAAQGRGEGTNESAGRLTNESSNETAVREAFRTIFGRSPETSELSAAVAFIDSKPASRDQQLCSLVWAMITSAEFRYNH